MLNLVQSALYYSKNSLVRLPLVFEASTTSYSTTQVQHQSGGNPLMSPRLLWEDGRTHYVFQDVTTTGGRHFILTYDERYGISRPIGFGGTVVETHHRPAIIKHNDKLYIVAEINHNSSAIRIWAGATNDWMRFDQSATNIGSIPTYPNLFNKNGVFTVLCQSNDINAMYSKNSSGDFEGTWTAEAQISQRQADEDEHYVASALNGNSLPNEVVFVIGGRNDDTSPATWFNKYIIRAEVTAGGITYYNWTKSFSTTSLISAAQMTTNYLYYATGGDTNQGYVPVTAVDRIGNFYDITGDGAGGYEFVYLITGQSSPTTKTVTLPGSPTILDGAGVGLDGQNGGCVFLLAISPNEVYAFFRIDVSGNGKIYMYRTTNLGDSWTFVVDVFSDISADIYGFTIPNNIIDIPDNRNFLCVGTGTGAPNSVIYMKRAAFGTVQTTDTDNLYDDYSAYSESEYDALMLRSYYVEAGKITNTGTTLNTLIDQSASAQDATAVASPVIDNATTPTFATFNGTNNAMQIPTTGLLALEEATIIAVAKLGTGAGINIVTFSRNGVANPFQTYGKSAADLMRHADSGLTLEGSTTVTNAFHIFVWTLQNGKSAALEFLDGELQFRTETTPATDEGRFTLGMSTIDRVQIARLVRNTTAYSAFDFKHLAITGTPMTQEQLARSLKYLSAKYSISLTDHYD